MLNRIPIERLELYVDHHVAAISLVSSLVTMRDSMHWILYRHKPEVSILGINLPSSPATMVRSPQSIATSFIFLVSSVFSSSQSFKFPNLNQNVSLELSLSSSLFYCLPQGWSCMIPGTCIWLFQNCYMCVHGVLTNVPCMGYTCSLAINRGHTMPNRKSSRWRQNYAHHDNSSASFLESLKVTHLNLGS